MTPKVGQHAEFTAELLGRPAILRGSVVYARDGLEFGLRFAELDEDVSNRVRTVATG